VGDDDANRRVRLCEAINRHLRDNPHAADTADGILACWLPRPEFQDARQFIAPVLEEMVKRGLLRQRRLPGGKILYVRGDAISA
jgi:hypothetical protein